jgi:hypothetical protein
MKLFRIALTTTIAFYASAFAYNDNDGFYHNIQYVGVPNGVHGYVDRKGDEQLSLRNIGLGSINGDIETIGATISIPINGGYNFNPVGSAGIHNSTLTGVKCVNTNCYNSATFNFSKPINDKNKAVNVDIRAKDIVFARLYWAGGLSNVWNMNQDFNAMTNRFFSDIRGFKNISFGTPSKYNGQYYHSLSANEGDTRWYGAYTQRGMQFMYHASVDVTNIIRNMEGNPILNNATFNVGGIKTSLGYPQGIMMYRDGGWLGYRYDSKWGSKWNYGSAFAGHYGGWALTIVYDLKDDDKAKAKTVSIFDGLYILAPIHLGGNSVVDKEALVKFEGFYTPPQGDIRSSLTVFSFGAKKEVDSEDIQIKKGAAFQSIGDGSINKPGGQFNSTISKFGQHMDSSKKYNNQVDLDIYDISKYITNRQTSADVKLRARVQETSSGLVLGERSNISFVAFATDAYIPNVCYEEDLFVKGKNEDESKFKPVSTNANSKTVMRPGDILRTKLTIRNDSNDNAEYLSIAAKTDVNASYQPNSTYVKPYANSGDAFELGSNFNDNSTKALQAYFKDKGTLTLFLGKGAKQGTGGLLDITKKSFVQYDVSLKAGFQPNVAYEATFKNNSLKFEIKNKRIKKCVDKKYYLTVFDMATIKIVNEKFTKKGDSENLYTQLTGKQFNVKIAYLNSDLPTGSAPKGPDEPIKVKIDAVDSCPAGASILASPIADVELNKNNGMLPLENILINNAYRAVSFRISYEDPYTKKYTAPECISDLFTVRPEKFVGYANGSVKSTSDAARISLIGGRAYPAMGIAAVYNTNKVANNYAGNLKTDTDHTEDKDKTQLVKFSPDLTPACRSAIDSIVITNIENMKTTASFSNGIGTLKKTVGTTNSDFSYPDIGPAKLYLKDSTFTAVDSGSDCIKGSDSTEKVNGKVGCDITGSVYYRFFPTDILIDQFQISDFANNMTYISSNRNLGENMAASATFNIQARIEGGNTARLYTRSCYATQNKFTIGIDKVIPGYTDNSGKVVNHTSTNPAVIAADLNAINNEVLFFDNDTLSSTRKDPSATTNLGRYTVEANAFADTDGIARVTVNFNFARPTNVAKNPFKVNSDVFNFANISAASGDASISPINSAPYTKPTGTKLKSTNFYYGQVYAPTYTGPKDGFGATIFYGVYCNGCNTTTYPLAAGDALPQTTNWFVNKAHQNINQGTHGTFSHAATTTIASTGPIVNGQEPINLSSTIIGTDIIHMQASSWLIYDPTSATATTNRFTVIFIDPSTMSWGGKALNKDQKDVGVGNVVGSEIIEGEVKINDLSEKPSNKLSW